MKKRRITPYEVTSMKVEVAKRTVGKLRIEVDRGFIDDQFVRHCYTLAVHTQIAGRDGRQAAWEFTPGPDCHFRYLGHMSDGAMVEHIRGWLIRAVERFER